MTVRSSTEGAEMDKDNGGAATGERQSRARPGDEILPTRWRKKPVVIEAIRWSGTNLKEVIDFTGLHPSADKWTWAEYEAVVAKDGFKIFTLEGPHMVARGDYIIKGVKGEFYACKPDIFVMTYERVSAVSESAATVQVDLGALEELSLMAAISTADPTIDELERILDAIGDRVEELIAGRQSPPSATGPMFDVVQLSEARYYRDHKEPIGILARAILRANGEMK